MTRRDGPTPAKRWARLVLCFVIPFFLSAVFAPGPARGQTGVPTDQFHLSITLGGHFLIGFGFSHFMEEHHALEFTLFPFAHPREGFPFGIRGGYAWIPSDEIWRAKLGANVTVFIQPQKDKGSRFTPTLGLTPGIRYDPDSDRSFRADLWMSYYLREKVFVPTGIEFIYAWPK